MAWRSGLVGALAVVAVTATACRTPSDPRTRARCEEGDVEACAIMGINLEKEHQDEDATLFYEKACQLEARVGRDEFCDDFARMALRTLSSGERRDRIKEVDRLCASMHSSDTRGDTCFHLARMAAGAAVDEDPWAKLRGEDRQTVRHVLQVACDEDSVDACLALSNAFDARIDLAAAERRDSLRHGRLVEMEAEKRKRSEDAWREWRQQHGDAGAPTTSVR
jgi:hypothetical protein